MPCAVAQGMARGLRVITKDASGSRLTLETGQSSSSAQLKEDTMLTSGSRATLLAMARMVSTSGSIRKGEEPGYV